MQRRTQWWIPVMETGNSHPRLKAAHQNRLIQLCPSLFAEAIQGWVCRLLNHVSSPVGFHAPGTCSNQIACPRMEFMEARAFSVAMITARSYS